VKSRRAAAGALGLDGGRARARHLGLLGGDELRARGAGLQPARHAHQDFSPLGFQRGHLPHPDRGPPTLPSPARGGGLGRGSLDAAPNGAKRGIEAQTRKLFAVCRLRDVPIITFVNKLDREARHPFDLLDEIEQALALDVTPASWPIGMGRDFLGTYDLFADALLLFERGVHDRVTEPVRCSGLDDPQLARLHPKEALAKLREEVEMAKGLCPPFDAQAYRESHLTPVYFGSALNNFGVRELLAGVGELAPAPRPQPADPRPISPGEPRVAGFVFKVQANIDPQRRDRIAFVRIASGRFQRGMKLKNIRTGRVMSVQAPVFFLARERNLAEEAWPGDIIGVPNHGSLSLEAVSASGSTPDRAN
jgi:peptide chain release factor 3